MSFKKGNRPWNIGLTRTTDPRVDKIARLNTGKKGKKRSKETREKMRQSCLGHIVSEETRTKIREGNLGKKVSTETKRKLSVSGKAYFQTPEGIENKKKRRKRLLGSKQSAETIEKKRKAILNLSDFKGFRGSLKHQKLVSEIATKMNNGQNIVEIEKAIKFPSGKWKIIDVLINNKICLEIGRCEEEKIMELKENGFEVVNFPYSYFEGEI